MSKSYKNYVRILLSQLCYLYSGYCLSVYAPARHAIKRLHLDCFTDFKDTALFRRVRPIIGSLPLGASVEAEGLLSSLCTQAWTTK